MAGKKSGEKPSAPVRDAPATPSGAAYIVRGGRRILIRRDVERPA